MKFLLLALFLCMVVAGCRSHAPAKKAEAFPGDFNKLPLLSEDAAFRDEYLPGVRAVRKDLLSRHEEPAEFRVWIREVNHGDLLAFNVVHLTSLEERNRNVLGNRSGKDRIIMFDVSKGEIISSLFTQ